MLQKPKYLRNEKLDKDLLSISSGIVHELLTDPLPETFGVYFGTKAPNSKNEKGETAVFHSCKFDMARTLTNLIAEGNNINLPDDKGVTPIQVAIKLNYLDIIKILVSSHALINPPAIMQDAVQAECDVSKWLFESNTLPLDYISTTGDSILMMAARAEKMCLIEYYLSKVRKPVYKNNLSGEEMYQVASTKFREEHNLEMYQKHIKKLLPIHEDPK